MGDDDFLDVLFLDRHFASDRCDGAAGNGFVDLRGGRSMRKLHVVLSVAQNLTHGDESENDDLLGRVRAGFRTLHSEPWTSGVKLKLAEVCHALDVSGGPRSR